MTFADAMETYAYIMDLFDDCTIRAERAKRDRDDKEYEFFNAVGMQMRSFLRLLDEQTVNFDLDIKTPVA